MRRPVARPLCPSPCPHLCRQNDPLLRGDTHDDEWAVKEPLPCVRGVGGAVASSSLVVLSLLLSFSLEVSTAVLPRAHTSASSDGHRVPASSARRGSTTRSVSRTAIGPGWPSVGWSACASRTWPVWSRVSTSHPCPPWFDSPPPWEKISRSTSSPVVHAYVTLRDPSRHTRRIANLHYAEDTTP
jgi:hypothetical protein